VRCERAGEGGSRAEGGERECEREGGRWAEIGPAEEGEDFPFSLYFLFFLFP
jgi:hypothetical protein